MIDGYDSLNKIKTSNSSHNNIYLIGNCKYDKFLNYVNRNEKISSLGVCINHLDNFIDLKLLIKELKNSYPEKKIFIRPHPSDPRFYKIKSFCYKNELFFSDSRTIKSFDFLKNIKTLIAGDSNIHIEALAMNIPSIYLNLENKKIDWYGFLKYKILLNGDSVNQIIQHINKINYAKIEVKKSLIPFNSAINTPYEGKSYKLALKIINDDKEFIEKSFIKNIENNNNYIYELK